MSRWGRDSDSYFLRDPHPSPPQPRKVRREEADLMAKSIMAMGHWLKRVLFRWSEAVGKMAERREDKVRHGRRGTGSLILINARSIRPASKTIARFACLDRFGSTYAYTSSTSRSNISAGGVTSPGLVYITGEPPPTAPSHSGTGATTSAAF